jgi:multidrug efflux pump
MGVAVFSGMLGVTFFGLFLTPVFYVVVRTFEKRITGRVRPVNHSTSSLAAAHHPYTFAAPPTEPD